MIAEKCGAFIVRQAALVLAEMTLHSLVHRHCGGVAIHDRAEQVSELVPQTVSDAALSVFSSETLRRSRTMLPA